MQLEDMILVSCDDHVIEPPDMFERHVPERWKDQAPKSVLGDDGIERWWFQGVSSGSGSLNAVVGWPKEEWGMDPTTFAEMRPGAYDIHERIRDMNRNGILSSMCFPSFAGFSARFFQEAADKDLALIMLKAYNDWHIDEWCTSYPGRFMPISLGPVWDPEALVEEVHRVAAKGCRAMTMPELPHVQGLPSYHDTDYWGPYFDACCDEGMVMCLHIGAGLRSDQLRAPGPDRQHDHRLQPDLADQRPGPAVGAGVQELARLKTAWSEGGIGWIPSYLNRCDRHYTNQRWLGHDFGGKLPSEIFREHSLACYISDPTALKWREDIGIDIIAWECDYPHSDCIWPDAPETLHRDLGLAGASDEHIDKITWQNTARWFGYDPFTHIPKEQATVGALRALSPDVDVTVRSKREWRSLYESAGAGAAH